MEYWHPTGPECLGEQVSGRRNGGWNKGRQGRKGGELERELEVGPVLLLHQREGCVKPSGGHSSLPSGLRYAAEHELAVMAIPAAVAASVAAAA